MSERKGVCEGMVEIDGSEVQRLVQAVYRANFRGRGGVYAEMREDVIGAGVLGALVASKRYDERMGVKLTTYMWEYVRRYMEKFARAEAEWRGVTCGDDGLEWHEDVCGEDVAEAVTESVTLEANMEKVRECCGEMKGKSRVMAEKLLRFESRQDIASEMGCSKQNVFLAYQRLCKRVKAKYDLVDGGLVDKAVDIKGECEQQ